MGYKMMFSNTVRNTRLKDHICRITDTGIEKKAIVKFSKFVIEVGQRSRSRS